MKGCGVVGHPQIGERNPSYSEQTAPGIERPYNLSGAELFFLMVLGSPDPLYAVSGALLLHSGLLMRNQLGRWNHCSAERS